MTKLTTDRLEKLQDNLLQFQDAYSAPADKENYDIFVDALHVIDEFKAAKEKLLAYEQADKTTDLKTLVISEIVDFYSGFESPYEPETVDEAQRQLIGRIEKVFGLAAPVLPKQPELVDLSQQVEILNRILNWILKELPVPTQKASAMAIRLSSVIDVISDLEVSTQEQEQEQK